jgi:hypothetical protein
MIDPNRLQEDSGMKDSPDMFDPKWTAGYGGGANSHPVTTRERTIYLPPHRVPSRPETAEELEHERLTQHLTQQIVVLQRDVARAEALWLTLATRLEVAEVALRKLG